MDVDPDGLLTLLKGDGSVDRDLQIIALEQLCRIHVFLFHQMIDRSILVGMLLLMSDNIDRCFEQ